MTKARKPNHGCSRPNNYCCYHRRFEFTEKISHCLKNRDCFYFKDCRRTNQLRTAIAIYLLGKLRAEEAILPLCELLDEKEFEKEFYYEIKELTYKFNQLKNFNEVKFQIFTQTVIALTKLAKEYKGHYKKIKSILMRVFEDDTYLKSITSLPEGTFENQTLINIRDYIRKTLLD